MGISVSGAGTSGLTPAVMGQLAIKNAVSTRTGSSRKASQKPKKQLNYNHRDISGQLVRVKKAQSASTVLTRAKGKLAGLQRCLGTGQYNDREVSNAIAHARRMVRCAQLKVRNLKEEEMDKKSYDKKSGAKKVQKESEIRRRVAQKERALESRLSSEQMQDVMREKRMRQRMMQKRRMHRADEQGKINEADMKYFKGMMENNQNQGGGADTGVLVELSASAAARSDLALAEAQMMAQIEQEVRAQIEAEMAATGDIPGMPGESGTAAPDVSAMDASAPAEAAVSVDIAL